MTKKAYLLTFFLVFKVILQYVLVSPAYDLQRDEYLYLDQANHLAWGYLSVPPFTSWVSLLIKLLGNGVFWVRLFPALFGALTTLVVWKAIEALKGDAFALVLGATCITFSVLLRLNTLYQPNSMDVLSWTTFCYCIIRYLTTEKAKWLYCAAVVFALGFLNKYNIVFLLLGILPAALLTRHRVLFQKPSFYIAATLAFLIVLPNLLWQYNNHFPFVAHLHELAATQLIHVNRLDFFKSQLLFFIGSLLVIIAGFWSLLYYAPFKTYRLFFFSFIFTMALFVFFKAKDYYAIGIYPIYISFGSVYLSAIFKGKLKTILRLVSMAIPVLLFIPILQLVFPNKSPQYIVQHSHKYKQLGLLRWEDGQDHALPQDFADMLGWKELAHKVDSVYSAMPKPANTLVLCDNYGQAGAINYYSAKGIKAVSFSADYLNWFDLNKSYNNLIRVKVLSGRADELKKTAPYFQVSQVADSITNPYAREYGTTIFSFMNAKVNINERIKKEIAAEKSHFH